MKKNASLNQRSALALTLLSFPILACDVPPGPGEESASAAAVEPVKQAAQAANSVPSPASDQVKICTDPGMGGSCTLITAGFYAYPVLIPDNTLSSLQIGTGVRLTAFRDPEFSGTAQTFEPGTVINDMGSTNVGDNSMSSLRVVSTSTPDCRPGAVPPLGWTFLYRDSYYTGDCVALRSGDYYHPSVMGIANDSISSVRMGHDVTLTLYNDVGFNGSYLLAGGTGNSFDEPTLGSSNEVISSLRMSQPGDPNAAPASNQVKICTNGSLGGTCQFVTPGFYAYSSIIPNDSLSSFQVGSGVRVTFFTDSEFRGGFMSFDPYTYVADIGRTPFGNDTMSSLRVVSTSTPDCRTGNAPPVGWGYLYREVSYAGDCVALSDGEYYHPSVMGIANDSISSMRMASNLGWTIYLDPGFNGTNTSGGRNTGVYDLSTMYSGFNDVISSIRMRH